MKFSLPTSPGKAWLRRGCLIMIVLVVSTVAQARSGRVSVKKPWSSKARRQTVQRLAERSQDQREQAVQRAREEGWSVDDLQGTKRLRLMAIRNNLPRVFKTRNLEAAISIAIPEVLSENFYDLLGTDQVVAIWDEDNVRDSHQELTGRVELMEQQDDSSSQGPGGFPGGGGGSSTSYSDHSTHVAGSIGASGVEAGAIGMAPEVEILSYDYDYDLSEVAEAAMSDPNETDTVQLSNHSYGYVAGWDYSYTEPYWYGTDGESQSYLFGLYDEETAQWDEIAYNAPYYLSFRAAGNDRADTAPTDGTRYWVYGCVEDNRWGGGQWQWYQNRYDSDDGPGDDGVDGGYDSLPPDSTAKNMMVVGAVAEAVDGNDRDPNAASMSYFSSWGPTNDGRIKPDVVACGVDLYSCIASSDSYGFGGSTYSDSNYDTYSGTSMATPTVTGGAALITELYEQYEPNAALLSSTIKGLVIHTADDLGNAGPDYQNGWGLVDINEALACLTQAMTDANETLLIEASLDANTPEAEWTLSLAAGEGLKATLCWTDPPATITDETEYTTPCLVHDLDLRVIDPNGQVTYPFVLDANEPAEVATTGDNTCDNVEQILINNIEQTGMYRLNITYKGNLQEDRQVFSLLVSRP